VIATLRPSDIVLHLSPPEAASARNALPGRVEEVAISGDRAHVRISSRPPLVAELTTDSVTRLGLVRGAFVWASFKAVEVSVTLI
jgi:molybdopterin-binding protein